MYTMVGISYSYSLLKFSAELHKHTPASVNILNEKVLNE